MKKAFFIFLVLVLGIIAFSFSKNDGSVEKNPFVSEESTPLQTAPGEATKKPDQNPEDVPTPGPFQPPLANPKERITKKPFGIFVSSQNSPVQPERFRGYHTGADFEILPGEEGKEISAKAVCSGPILQKRTASGYGGVLIQKCEFKNEPITVVYGHLRLTSVSKDTGQNLNTGENIGLLGRGYSSEADGERKHLHLGIYKGPSINILGYVQNQTDLSGWIDPCLLVCE